MELSEAWTADLQYEDIQMYGTLLDDKYDPQPYNNKEKVFCKLYYLESRDIFTMISPSGYWSIITSPVDIENCRVKYMNQEPRKFVNNAFTEYDKSNFNSFQSDLDLSDIETIKKNGRFLEKLQNQDIYYIELLDRFAVVDTEQETSHTFDSPDHRKKYNIPYQDERFSSL